MDSLGHLADNLPRNSSSTASLAHAEADLQASFRNSALAITQLLKASQKTSKKAYSAGYSNALSDILEYLQQNLDVNVQTEGLAITQAIDYIEARQEAVRLQGLEADGEEEQQERQQQQRQQFRTQEQEQQLQQQNLRYSGPIASTSAQPYQPPRKSQTQSRNQSRSVSPGAGRTGLTGGGSSGTRSPLLSASVTTQTTQPVMTQENELPSSSLPNSPDYRSSASSATPSFTFSSSSQPSIPPAPNDSSETVSSAPENAAQSPLTRLQARRERARHQDRRTRPQHHGHTRHEGSSAGSSVGMKRRWTASLLPEWSAMGIESEHNINLDGEESAIEGDDEEIPEEEADGVPDAQDVVVEKGDMEMDGTIAQGDTYRNDGSTRPIKRIVRR